MPIDAKEWEEGEEGISAVEVLLQKEAVAYTASEIIDKVSVSSASVYNQLDALRGDGKVDVKKLHGKRYWIHTSHVNRAG